jgi:fatty acid desaturase
MRQEQKVNGWLVEHGVPAGGATALLWIVKLVVLGVLLYVAFWLALLLVFAVAAAWMIRDSDHDESEEWAVGEQAEHKNNSGYHPVLYNDAPDSRYADPRYDDD